MSVFPQLRHFKNVSTVQVEMYDRVTESQLIVEISSSVTKIITCIFYSCLKFQLIAFNLKRVVG